MRLNAGGFSDLVIGRSREIKTIQSYIQMGQHTVLIAPRRYGKTTLANKVLSDLPEEILVVRIDVFESSSIRELCEQLINGVYASMGVTHFVHQAREKLFDLIARFKLEVEQQGIRLGYDLLQEQDESALVKKAFELPQQIAALFDRKMVVFFDEFGDVKRFGGDLIKKLRAIFQRHDRVSYLFAGSQTTVLQEIFLDQKNAFFNFATLMKVEGLNREETVQFLSELEIDGVRLEPEAVEWLLEKSMLHPFYLVKTIQEAWIHVLISGGDRMDLSAVEEGVNKILQDHDAYFEGQWQKINHKRYQGGLFKRFCGLQVVQEAVSSSYRSQLVKKMELSAVIGSNHRSTDPFLCLWLQRNHSAL